MIRTAKLASSLRTLPNANVRPLFTQRTAVARQALDAFDNGPSSVGLPNIGLNLGNGPSGVVTTPVNPTNSIVPTNNTTNVAAPTTPSSSSSGGGFFSKLWDGIKSFASGLLGKATSYLDGNWGSWMSSASSALGGLFSGLMDKAKGWLDGLLGNVTNKLDS